MEKEVAQALLNYAELAPWSSDQRSSLRRLSTRLQRREIIIPEVIPLMRAEVGEIAARCFPLMFTNIEYREAL